MRWPGNRADTGERTDAHVCLSNPGAIQTAIANARAAANEGEERYVALDIGPLGRMLAPLGDLPFEEAVALFAEIVKAGADGADLVAIETMNEA